MGRKLSAQGWDQCCGTKGRDVSEREKNPHITDWPEVRYKLSLSNTVKIWEACCCLFLPLTRPSYPDRNTDLIFFWKFITDFSSESCRKRSLFVQERVCLCLCSCKIETDRSKKKVYVWGPNPLPERQTGRKQNCRSQEGGVHRGFGS